MGGTRSGRNRRAHERGDYRRAASGESRRKGSRGDRRHQSARDHDRVESEDRPPLVQRHRVAGHADGSDRQRPRTETATALRTHGAAARDVLFRHEAAVDSRERRWRQSRRRKRRGGLRQCRYVGDLESHRRRRRRCARHRRHQREPHAAHGSAHARLGR